MNLRMNIETNISSLQEKIEEKNHSRSEQSEEQNLRDFQCRETLTDNPPVKNHPLTEEVPRIWTLCALLHFIQLRRQ